ncbi:hypothetical protein JHK84_052438 [Glycine max]|nr:hypothetical protein JHK86_052397 [Glycine max]KAG5082400.1 hypothetical protein JHK84_052438 [Glycine max]
MRRDAILAMQHKNGVRPFGRMVKDLIPHNIVVSEFYGKPSDYEGVICLDVLVGSRRRPIVFLVISSQANFNMFLGRELIYGVCVVRSTVHPKLFFWNQYGKLEMVKADPSPYGIYVAFVSESNQAMTRTAPFEIKDSFYVNNKFDDENDIFFCWNVNRGFLLINKDVEKMAKAKET